MKKRRLPPLNPLRSFEAAGRHGSFTRAAEELHVTPVAVSRQIAVLEGYFGLALFDRLHQTVQLTLAGRNFLPRVSAALDLLDEGSQLLRPAQGESLVVCTYNTMAIRWLIPRLRLFREQYPEIDISIMTAITYPEFDYDDIDVGIQYVESVPADVISQVILPDIIHPICSPKLMHGPHPLPPESNLKHHTFLHSQYRRSDWDEWLQAAGIAKFKPVDEFTFKGSGLAYQAAAEGLGVALAQRLLIMDDLKEGRLVAPFRYAAQRASGMSMVTKRKRLNDPKVALFQDWLEAQAALTSRELGVESAISKKGIKLIELA